MNTTAPNPTVEPVVETKVEAKADTKTPPQLRELTTLRDELRVQAHLAAMDVKDRWTLVEPKVEKLIGEVEAAGRELGLELAERVGEMLTNLGRLLESYGTATQKTAVRAKPRGKDKGKTKVAAKRRTTVRTVRE